MSIDLIIRDGDSRVLLGLRSNAPACGYWFVPGGRIFKDEPVEQAFRRISRDEVGATLAFDEARFLGVYAHLYQENFAGHPGFGTHYVVLVYELLLHRPLRNLPTAQHNDCLWWMSCSFSNVRTFIPTHGHISLVVERDQDRADESVG